MTTESSDTAYDYGARPQTSQPGAVRPASKLSERRPLKPVVAGARSTVAMKAAMAVTGLIMLGFLIMHMLGNLWVFAGQSTFDAYSHHIRTVGEPIIPAKTALWILRVLLLGSVVIHIAAALTLWRRNVAAVGGRVRYRSKQGRRGVQRSYASFTMRWGGVIILLFIVYHLLHLTANQIHPGGPSSSPYERVVAGFEIWWVVVSYTVAMLAVGMHLTHGFWSAVASLGGNRSPRRRHQLRTIATTLALLITVGFLVPPYSILFGWIG